MSQRKKKQFFAIAILLFAFIVPFFINASINLKQAEQAQKNGDFQTAAKFYAQSAKILFWKNDLWEKAGIAAAKAGNFEESIFYFQKVNIFSEQGWAWFGTAYFQTGAVENAILTFESGVTHFQSAVLYRLLASAQRTQKNWQAEKDALEQQIQLDDQDAYAHYRLGVLLMVFSPDDAFDKLQRASTLNPQVDSATQTLITALNIASTQSVEAEKRVTIGRALGLVQEWDLAKLAFEQAIAVDSQNAEAWAWLGETKQQLGQDGSVELNQALELKRTSATVRALRALYWNRQEKYSQMLAEYLLASEYEPNNPAWKVGIGEAHTKLGDLISALTAYQQATELESDNATYWRLLAVFCAENNVYIEEIGLPAIQEAFRLSPNDVTVLDGLGFVYFASGRYTNAENNFLAAIELDPDYFPAHLHLALNYLAQDKRNDAYNTLIYIRDTDASGLYRASAQDLLNRYFP